MAEVDHRRPRRRRRAARQRAGVDAPRGEDLVLGLEVRGRDADRAPAPVAAHDRGRPRSTAGRAGRRAAPTSPRASSSRTRLLLTGRSPVQDRGQGVHREAEPPAESGEAAGVPLPPVPEAERLADHDVPRAQRLPRAPCGRTPRATGRPPTRRRAARPGGRRRARRGAPPSGRGCVRAAGARSGLQDAGRVRVEGEHDRRRPPSRGRAPRPPTRAPGDRGARRRSSRRSRPATASRGARASRS